MLQKLELEGHLATQPERTVAKLQKRRSPNMRRNPTISVGN